MLVVGFDCILAHSGSGLGGRAPGVHNMLSLSCRAQVYGIISAQLVLTAVVAGTVLAVPPVRTFVTTSLWFQLTCAILPLVGECDCFDCAMLVLRLFPICV